MSLQERWFATASYCLYVAVVSATHRNVNLYYVCNTYFGKYIGGRRIYTRGKQLELMKSSIPTKLASIACCLYMKSSRMGVDKASVHVQRLVSLGLSQQEEMRLAKCVELHDKHTL